MSDKKKAFKYKRSVRKIEREWKSRKQAFLDKKNEKDKKESAKIAAPTTASPKKKKGVAAASEPPATKDPQKE